MLEIDPWIRVLRDRQRRSIEQDPNLRVVLCVAEVASAEHVLDAELEGVAAGDVVRGKAPVVLMVVGANVHERRAVGRTRRCLQLPHWEVRAAANRDAEPLAL